MPLLSSPEIKDLAPIHLAGMTGVDVESCIMLGLETARYIQYKRDTTGPETDVARAS